MEGGKGDAAWWVWVTLNGGRKCLLMVALGAVRWLRHPHVYPHTQVSASLSYFRTVVGADVACGGYAVAPERQGPY